MGADRKNPLVLGIGKGEVDAQISVEVRAADIEEATAKC